MYLLSFDYNFTTGGFFEALHTQTKIIIPNTAIAVYQISKVYFYQIITVVKKQLFLSSAK